LQGLVESGQASLT
jgi:hypothetical protein